MLHCFSGLYSVVSIVDKHTAEQIKGFRAASVLVQLGYKISKGNSFGGPN